MSMPNIPDIKPIIDIDREEAVTMLLASIALEEMGLAHLINAEGEKIQYVLNADANRCTSTCEIKEINQSVERVLHDVLKIQRVLQDKLENVITIIPKTPDCHSKSCSQTCKPTCKPTCVLEGYADGCICNESDLFYGSNVTLDASVTKVEEFYNTLSIKYTLCDEKDHKFFSALLLSLPDCIEIKCSNKTRSYPTTQEPNKILICGQSVMAITGTECKLDQCTVNFNLTVWDFGRVKEFQMITNSPNEAFNHDSGKVPVSSGNLKIIDLQKNNKIL